MVFDDLAVRIAAQFDLYLFALAGRYHQMRAPGIEVTPRAIVDLCDDVRALNKTFYQTASTELDVYLAAVGMDAGNKTLDGLHERKQALQAYLRDIVLDCADQVIKMAKTGRGTFADLLKNAHGAMGLLAQRQAGKIEFKAYDTAGRSWNAKRLVYAVVRDAAYQSFIDIQVDDLLRATGDLVLTSHGQVLSLRGTDGYPSFASQRDFLFHPNSTTVIVSHYVSP